MSFRILRGFNVRFCRQAYILAHAGRVEWMPGRSRLRLSLSTTQRYAHNSLYQMVKKRTLEARTKLQANKFPNNQPCITQKAQQANPTCIPPVPISCTDNMSAPSPANLGKKANEPESSPIQTQATTFQYSNKQKICQNTEILEAHDCHFSTKTSSDPCPTKPVAAPPPRSATTEPRCPPKDAAAAGGGGGAASSGNDGLPKWMLALLALGAGGLLWLLFFRKKKGDSASKDGGECKNPLNAEQTVPASSADLPKHVPYLLIGGGTASFSAFRAIKSNDARAKVLMITNEHKKPYMRPPLSKELWYSAQSGETTKDYRFKQWTGSERSLYFEPEEFFVDPTKLTESVNGGIAVAQGFTVRKVDPAKRIVTLNDGYEIGYDECLIATGCTPKNLELFSDAPLSVKEKIMVYRSPDDFERLKRYADEKKSITIIGNGFIGSELACSLANYSKDRGVRIYQVFPEAGNMSRVLPDYLSTWTTRKVEALGVCVLPKASVKEATRDETQLRLVLNNGTTILTDVAVVCVGCEANTNIATLSGLEVDRSLGGFVVNAELEARRNLFVAGDASCFYDPLLGRRRVEHHDHSVVSGRLAGENMVGKKKAYAHQSMFWSDLGPEIGYEGIGLVDASLPTVGVFSLPSDKADRKTDNLTEVRSEELENLKSGTDLPDINCNDKDKNVENYGRGVIFYMKDDKIVGILLWNLFNRIGLARTIINQNKKFDDLNEVAKLFEIHS